MSNGLHVFNIHMHEAINTTQPRASPVPASPLLLSLWQILKILDDCDIYFSIKSALSREFSFQEPKSGRLTSSHQGDAALEWTQSFLLSPKI
jgi:hypothetical protein